MTNLATKFSKKSPVLITNPLFRYYTCVTGDNNNNNNIIIILYYYIIYYYNYYYIIIIIIKIINHGYNNCRKYNYFIGGFWKKIFAIDWQE